MKPHRLVVLLVMSLAAGLVSIVSPTAAYATDRNPCQGLGIVKPKDLDQEIPVILVHGFRGGASDWGTIDEVDSFFRKVDNIPGAKVVQSFQYNSWKWVDAQQNGPRLAKLIDCYAHFSYQNGGSRQVILVGYSMGGLVIRDAISRQSYDGQWAIQDRVAQVITIGTPHMGATLPLVYGLAWKTHLNNFIPGSEALQKLAHVPSDIPSFTIAGDVTKVYVNEKGKETKRERLYDDTLVATNSAHFDSNALAGGGERTFSCDKQYKARRINSLFYSYVTYDSKEVGCEHSALIRNQSNGVRQAVVDAITAYLIWHDTPRD
ncbi:MAG: hypothetical protein WBP12_02120 [Candidatus Saccharimonas sp.]